MVKWHEHPIYHRFNKPNFLRVNSACPKRSRSDRLALLGRRAGLRGRRGFPPRFHGN